MIMKKNVFLGTLILICIFNFSFVVQVEAQNEIIDVTTLGTDKYKGDPSVYGNKDLTILANTPVDQTAKIQQAILAVQSRGDSLYFPKGTYIVQSNIELRNGGTIFGDPSGETIFDGSSAQNMLYLKRSGFKPSRQDVIKNLTFKNIGVSITTNNNFGVSIENNLFYNGKYTEKEGAFYISLTTADGKDSLSNVDIKNNILLRGNGYAGRGIGTYGTTDVTIEKNFIGKTENLEQATILNPTLFNKKIWLDNNKTEVNGNQGNFVTGINAIDNDKNLKIVSNYISGSNSPNVYDQSNNAMMIYPDSKDEVYRYRRDHVVYAKGYDKLTILENYFSGWTNDSAGGIKIRNGSKLFMGSNYLDDVPILSYVYGDMPNKLMLEQTFIYNNLYHAISPDNISRKAFLYWQDFIQLPDNKVSLTNNIYYRNKIMTSQRALEPVDHFVFQPKDSESIKEFYWSENKYINNHQEVLVKLNSLELSSDNIHSEDVEEKIQAIFPEFMTEYKEKRIPVPYIDKINTYNFGDERLRIELPPNVNKVNVFINGVQLNRGVITNQIFEVYVKDKLLTKTDILTILPITVVHNKEELKSFNLEGNLYPIEIH